MWTPTCNRRAQWLRLLVMCMLLSCAGCASWKPKIPGWDKLYGRKDQPNPQVPEKIVALWSDTVYYQAGGAPTRGLGGRVYFYNAKESPVPVSGKLVVYAFEDGLESNLQMPEDIEHWNLEAAKKYVFTPEQLVTHYSPSEFGPSYSLWLPWDQVGNDAKAVSVVPVFVDDSGKLVMGQSARHRLTGNNPATLSKSGHTKAAEARQTAERLAADEERAAARQLQVATITRGNTRPVVETPAVADHSRQPPAEWVQRTSFSAAEPISKPSVHSTPAAQTQSIPNSSQLPSAAGQAVEMMGGDSPFDPGAFADRHLGRGASSGSQRSIARQPIRPTRDPNWRNAPRFNRQAADSAALRLLPND